MKTLEMSIKEERMSNYPMEYTAVKTDNFQQHTILAI